jgi:hypothetical protein
MTDTTQVQSVASPRISASFAAASRKSGYLFGPVADFLCLGGGSIIVCGLIALFLPRGIPSADEATLIVLLMTLINQPHFAHSYQMFYRDFRAKAFGPAYAPGLRRRYVVAGLIVPAALIVFLGGTIAAGNARALGYGANLMFFLVGWHYVKQGYGILIVDSVQKRLMFPDSAKAIFRINGYACWAVAWLAVNHALATNHYIGLAYYALPVPGSLYVASIIFATLTSLAALGAFARKWRETHGQAKTPALPWNGVVAYVTTLYLWVIFVRINPLIIVVVPTFHSLQYLAVVWRYQLNAGAREALAQRRATMLERVWPDGAWRRLALFVGLGTLAGYLGFMAVPGLLDKTLPYDHHLFGPSLFVFAFYIFINVHHYMLDNVMWRRGNPDVQQYIFSAPKR